MDEDDDDDSALSDFGLIHSVEDDPNSEINSINITNINFDKYLPAAHSYLGNDLEETKGRTMHDDDAYLRIPIISLPGVVLMPGQMLPLCLFHDRDIAMVKHVLDHDKTFGQLTNVIPIYEEMKSVAMIGTTVEVLAVKDESNSLKVKAVGRQRFLVLDHQRDIGGVIIARVKILPEIIMADPFELIQSSYLQRSFRKYTPQRIKKHLTSTLTSNPPWVFNQYNPETLMREIREEMQSWNNAVDISGDDSQEAAEFSFRVASVLPIDDVAKLRLLSMGSAIQRLRYELNIMKKCTFLCCCNCSLQIANKNEVFSMSVEGPMGAYVNPGGIVHETFTVYKCANINLVGSPSTQSSWFPGYAWTIGICKQCKRHMGWRFTVDDKDSNLSPPRFWGLCRSSVVLKFNADQPIGHCF